jgi:hypothetical protein
MGPSWPTYRTCAAFHFDCNALTVEKVEAGELSDDDYDVLADGAVVGRILKVHAAPVGTPWMWTLAFWHHEDRTPTHGSTATRKAASVAVIGALSRILKSRRRWHPAGAQFQRKNISAFPSDDP